MQSESPFKPHKVCVASQLHKFGGFFFEMHNKWVKICWNKGSILHTIICICILYGFCIQIVYMFMLYALSRSELMYTKCIQNEFRILTNLYTFCIQSVYKMFVYKMYPIFWQTFVYKMYTTCQQTFVYILCTIFCWCSFFDVVYKMYTSLLKYVIHFVYILYTSVVYILCNFCIQNVYTVSKWEGNKVFHLAVIILDSWKNTR